MKALIEARPEGVYCPSGDFYIDPWQPVARAVITHGHGDHARAGMGEYHTSTAGLPILQWRLGEQRYVAHDYGAPFDLGGSRVSLHPAGHVLGSAQVRIEAQGHVWVVSGDYKRDPDPTCTPFEVVPCDGFVTEATFALPVYRWRPTAAVAADILAWWDECREEGVTALLFCYALGKAQRILAELAALVPAAEYPARVVLLHGAIVPGVEIYRAAGVRMLPTAALTEADPQAASARAPATPAPRKPRRAAMDYAGQLVLAPPAAKGTPWMRRFRQASTGFASGWMRIRGNRRRRGYERGFVISDHADWPSLLATVRATGAREVLVTHGNAEALVHVLGEAGIAAGALRTNFGDEI
jgi:putative mRNA 3-end processing factor